MEKNKYETIPLEEVECSICGKVEKVFYVNDLVLPYLCTKHYAEMVAEYFKQKEKNKDSPIGDIPYFSHL